MTAPKSIVAGATTAMTRRTVLRKAFLGPWHPVVTDIWLYAMADAQKHTRVAVHHGVKVIDHHHLTVTAESDNLPEFSRRLHGDVSCALNVLLARERYDAPGQLFDGRDPHYMRLVDAAAQGSHIVYEQLNCVAAGLVDRPQHMPDYRFDFELWKKGYIEVRRPEVYFSDSRPEVQRLYVTPPPLLYRAFDGDIERLVSSMKRLSVQGARELWAARSRPAMGARAVTRLHPWSEPTTLKEAGGQRTPTFKVGADGIVGRKARIDCATETSVFRQRYRDARSAWADGDRGQVFPFGTYEMRVRHGAVVEADACEGALLTAPGPLLADIEAELADAPMPTAAPGTRTGDVVADEVREAFTDEASDICAEAEVSYDFTTQAVGDDRGPALVRHRFDKRRDHLPREDTRRLIIKRDRRRGRPPGSTGHHGSDPPA